MYSTLPESISFLTDVTRATDGVDIVDGTQYLLYQARHFNTTTSTDNFRQ